MKFRIARVVVMSCALFVVLEVISCRIFDDVIVQVDAEGVLRESIRVTPDLELSYLSSVNVEPDAQRLIFVHGTPGNAGAFDDYLIDPLEGFESISIDRPGFGRTRPSAPMPSLRAQARAFEPLLVERGGKWPLLVGHSLGGPIIARAAADFPDRVGGLLILAGSLDPSLEKIAWYQRLANLPIVPYMIPRFVRNSNRELYPLKGELEALRPLLAEVKCPVIIVHSTDDSLVPFENVAYMEAAFAPGVIVEVVVLEGKNHFVPWNAEAEVRAAIVALAGASIDAELAPPTPVR